MMPSVLLCKREDVKGDACPGKPKKFQNIILYTSRISTYIGISYMKKKINGTMDSQKLTSQRSFLHS